MDPGTAEVCVFAPSPLLTLTIEVGRGEQPAMHLHGGGQGIWVATMLSVLGARGVLCGPFGGETGTVLRQMLEDEDFDVRPVPTAGGNGCYIEDRRTGELTCVADVPPTSLDRHELDDLHNNFLAAALECGTAVLTGTAAPQVVDAEVYRRAAADLAALGVPVVADLSGDALSAALEGGLSVLKVSDEDLVESGRADSDDLSDVVDAVEALCDQVDTLVVLTRGSDPALAWTKGQRLKITAPALHPLHHRGAGDSMTAAIAACLAAGGEVEEALRLGAAAGVVNVTRHGLATGQLATIQQVAERVSVEEWEPDLT